MWTFLQRVSASIDCIQYIIPHTTYTQRTAADCLYPVYYTTHDVHTENSSWLSVSSILPHTTNTQRTAADWLYPVYFHTQRIHKEQQLTNKSRSPRFCFWIKEKEKCPELGVLRAQWEALTGPYPELGVLRAQWEALTGSYPELGVLWAQWEGWNHAADLRPL